MIADKATDSTLVDPNWDAIIECVDLIRAGEVPVKSAIASIRKRYHNENPHIAHHALLVLEACMKNCGSKFHSEIATKEFMEDLKNLSLDATPDKVRNKILELLQCWAIAFKNIPEYKIVVDTHNLMKLAGFDFPQVAESDAMFIAESAPDWADGEECFRCRTAFGLITRKHHCRACGQIFCDKCSSKQSFLPQYGIEKQVRVCDGCFEKTTSKNKQAATAQVTTAPQSAKSGKSMPDDAKKTAEQRAQELKQAEEDELNLAIAISQSEAEAQEKEQQRRLYHLYNGNSVHSNDAKSNNEDHSAVGSIYKGTASTNADKDAQDPVTYEAHIDRNLARYLNRDYWQQRKNEQGSINSNNVASTEYAVQKKPLPTAPPPSESGNSRFTEDQDISLSVGAMSLASVTKHLEGEVTSNAHFIVAEEEEETAETMEFCRQLREQVTVMDNRIRSNIARNRSVVNDTGIQSLFIRLTEMHAQVMVRMNKLEDQRNFYESLQDHLAHIQEARQAVDALREDHERQKQEQALEEQRFKQLQMQQKVDLMRQKKHEMILHQRQMALMRFQQQEQEMQMKRMQMQQSVQLGLYNMPASQHSDPNLHVPADIGSGQENVSTAAYSGYVAPVGNYSDYQSQVPYGGLPQQYMPVSQVVRDANIHEKLAHFGPPQYALQSDITANTAQNVTPLHGIGGNISHPAASNGPVIVSHQYPSYQSIEQVLPSVSNSPSFYGQVGVGHYPAATGASSIPVGVIPNMQSYMVPQQGQQMAMPPSSGYYMSDAQTVPSSATPANYNVQVNAGPAAATHVTEEPLISFD